MQFLKHPVNITLTALSVFIGSVIGIIVFNPGYAASLLYQFASLLAAKPPEQVFLPAPKPFSTTQTSDLREQITGGFDVSWYSWTQEYTITHPIDMIQTYYQQEMATYCATSFEWHPTEGGVQAQCYIDPCEPPGMPEYNVTGHGPYQTFHVLLQPREKGKVYVQQSSFRSPDVCFDHSLAEKT